MTVAGKLGLVVSFYAVLIAFALHVFYWTPEPQPEDAPARLFAEARARQHVSVLTERIGVRSVRVQRRANSLPRLQAASLNNNYWYLMLHVVEADVLCWAEVSTTTCMFSNCAKCVSIVESQNKNNTNGNAHFFFVTCSALCVKMHMQVSTPGLQAAHHYIWGLTQDLQAAADARGDIIVQTAFENYTGSTDFDFVVRS